MWPGFDGKPYNRQQLDTHIRATDFSKWRRRNGAIGKPLYIVMHNTSEPTIELWMGWSVEKRQQYIHNVQDYYQHKLGWNAGPHFFVPPTPDPCAFGFSDLGTSGVHASCFNSDAIGIEHVGEFNKEAYDTGPGAIVRDNGIYLMALLHNRLGLQPEPYAYGVKGLHFHVECARDNHDCPGSHVHKADVIARIKAEMARLSAGGVTATPPAPAPEPDHTTRSTLFHALGKMSTFGGPHDTGVSQLEGLALYGDGTAAIQKMIEHLGAQWVLTSGQAGAPGPARRINPDMFYLACRWPPDQYPILRDAMVHVRNPVNGRTVDNARAVDWGPNEHTGRVADLSPGLAKQLQLSTDQVVEITVYEDGK